MSTDEVTRLGRISITPGAIATIASQVATQSYGVVGMAAKNVVDELAHALARDPRHGVEVRIVDDHIVVDIYVVVEYGTRLSSVAASVANSVHYQIEKTIGMPVAAVNVHVQDLRVSDET